MLSKNKIKLISSLKTKKFRDKHHLFVAEGDKIVMDLYGAGAKIDSLFATNQWLISNNIIANVVHEVSEKELKTISQLKTPSLVIALIQIPNEPTITPDIKNELILGLDDIQDPGNLGTIIRTAAWFGIRHIVCSKNTVDCYNSKVVQSTMGSIITMNIIYTDLTQFIQHNKTDTWKVFGTFLSGENIYSETLPKCGMIIIGNEGKGISKQIEGNIDTKLLIPDYAETNSKPESLNAAIATAIICSEFKRQSLL